MVLVLIVPCRAAGEDTVEDSLDLSGLEAAAGEYGAGLDLDSLTLDGGLAQLGEQAERQMPRLLRSGLRSALRILVVALLCALAEGTRAGGSREGVDVVVMAGALAITAVSVGDMETMLGLGRQTIDRMQGFSQALLPAMAAITAALGAPAGAAVRQTATVLFSNLLLALIDSLLVPLVYAYVAACTAHAAVGNPGLKKVAEILKWVVTTALTAMLLLFVTYLTVSGAIAGSSDAAALKAAKMAISNAVPVVGRILSDAAEAILGGAGILKNTVGIFGMVVVLGMCITPFLQLGVHYLTYKLMGALTAVLADSRLAQLIDGISTAFGLILGMTGSCALLLLVSVVSGVAVTAS